MNWIERITQAPKLERKMQQYKALALLNASRVNINSSATTYQSWDVFNGKDRFLTNGDVYAVLKKIYETCARLPMYTYEVKPDEKKSLQRLRSLHKGHFIDGAAAFAIKALQRKALEEVDDTDPVEMLLNRPNPYQTRTEFFEAIYYWRTRGKWAVYKNRLGMGANAGRVKELYVLNPKYIGIKVTNTFPKDVTGYTYNIPGTGTTLDIDPEDIIIGKTFNPDDEFDGLDPLRPGNQNIQRGEAGEEVSYRQLKNGGIPGIVYNEEVSADDISQTDLDAIRDAYNDFTSNSNNKGKLFWAAGKVGVAQTGSTLSDLAVLDGEAVSFRKFCRVMNISPLLFGDTVGFTYENYKEAKKDAYTSTYVPITYSVADKLTTDLCSEFDDKQRVEEIDFSGIAELQEDMQKSASAIAAMPITLTGNEMREIWNYERSDAPYMDEPLIKQGYEPISFLQMPEPDLIP